MPHEGSLLQTAVIFLLAADIAVPLAKRLQLGAVIAPDTSHGDSLAHLITSKS